MQTFRSADGALTVRQSAPIAAKLFGIPFAAIGGWFLYQLVLAVVAAFSYPTIGDVLSVIPGLLLVTVMALAFGAPGLLLMLASLCVSVDPITHDLLATRDFVLFKRSERHRRDEIAAVSIADKRISSSTAEKPQWALHVEAELKKRTNKFILIALAKDLEEARSLANEFAAALSVPLVDRSAEPQAQEAEEEEAVADEA